MPLRWDLEHSTVAVIRTMVEINYLGAAYVTHYAIPLLRASQGSITFISSLSALHGLPYIAPYGASKLALKGLAESLRAELHTARVHVGIVHVGFTENDPGKVVYRQDGALVGLQRPRNSHTQQQAARAIVRSILRRRPECTLTLIGHMAACAYRFFPRLSDWAISSFASRSGMYGSIQDESQGTGTQG
jgi:short-subunit dehydrogenase